MLTLEDVFDNAYLRENGLLEPSIHTEALLLEETSMRADTVTESRHLCAELDQLVDHATGMVERYDHLNILCAHLKTYGLDQATLHLFNTDTVFKTLHIELPSLESFGSYEYQDKLQAAQESMLEIFQTAIDYVIQLWEKLKNWFARFVNFWWIRHMWYKRRQEKITLGLKNISADFFSRHKEELKAVPFPFDIDMLKSYNRFVNMWDTLNNAVSDQKSVDKAFREAMLSPADPSHAGDWFKDTRSMNEIKKSLAQLKETTATWGDTGPVLTTSVRTLSDVADEIKTLSSQLKYPSEEDWEEREGSSALTFCTLMIHDAATTLNTYDAFHKSAYNKIQANLSSCQQIARKYQFHYTQQQEDDGSARRMMEIARAAAQYWREYGKVAVASVNACFKSLDIEQRILLKVLAIYQKSERA